MSEPRPDSLPFLELAPGIGAGAPPAGWRPLAERPLLVLVGLTGVGKSTVLRLLCAQAAERSAPPALLPDRRTLTDRLLIAAVQAAEGLPVEPVHDRALRFEYTRRFRQRFAGGMAHALALLCTHPAQTPGLLLFDGLRGENEVTHAASALPLARFALLDAPDAVRVARLLGRSDPFDRIGAATDAEQAALRIVDEERQNYDPAATRRALQEHAPGRTLLLDTTQHAPAALATQIAAQLAHWWP